MIITILMIYDYIVSPTATACRLRAPSFVSTGALRCTADNSSNSNNNNNSSINNDDNNSNTTNKQ